MAIDEVSPSAQLRSDLRTAIQHELKTRKPLLHHLNADTSWLLQIPRPGNAVKRGARFYYNILIDPWLRGGQSDVASWFSQQFHATESAIQSVAQVEELIHEIETLASDGGEVIGKPDGENGQTEQDESLIDAVAVSHEFTDHMHKETLLEIHPDVPVFAIMEAASLINGWKHFRTVITVNVFGAEGGMDWRSTSIPPLPEWIGISRLLQKDDVLNYHAALMITFNNRHGETRSELAHTIGSLKNGSRKRHHEALLPDEDEESAEAVIYTPHGLHSHDLALVPSASPPISTLAFLHGLQNVRVGTASGRTALQSNLGAHNGLKAQRILKSKYWIGTHDEIKTGGGLVAWFLQRDEYTLKDALELERRQRQDGAESAAKGGFGEVLDSFDDCNWVDLRNGESRILK